MSVGVMKDCKLKLSDLRASHTLGWQRTLSLYNRMTLQVRRCTLGCSKIQIKKEDSRT